MKHRKSANRRNPAILPLRIVGFLRFANLHRIRSPTTLRNTDSRHNYNQSALVTNELHVQCSFYADLYTNTAIHKTHMNG